jgi:hypothetical protein
MPCLHRRGALVALAPLFALAAACGDPGGGLPDAARLEVQLIVEGAPPAFTNVARAEFAFASNLDDATFECALDGGPAAACDAAYAVDVVEGAHVLAVRARGLGDLASAVTELPWTLDQTAPDTALRLAPPLLTAEATFHFEFESDEPGATFQCSLDGGPLVPCEDLEGLPLADGPHTLLVYAVDPAGNPDPSPVEYTWVVDTSRPETVILDGPTATVAAGPHTFTFASPALVGAVTFECALDDAGFTACTSPHEVGPLPSGPHALQVRARAAAGPDLTPAERTFEVDAETTVEITSAPSDPTDQAEAAFAFVAEAGAAVTCEIVGVVAATPCTSPWSVALANGTHTFVVRATDGVGNAASASHTWTVAATEPAVTIVDGPAAVSGASTAALTFTLGGDVASVACALDGGPAAACASPVSYAGLADGPHEVVVTATSTGGATASDTWSWTIDTVAPTVVLDGPTHTTEVSPTYTFVLGDPSATVTCWVDDQPPALCTSPFVVGPLADGQHTVHVRAVDAAGNPGVDAIDVLIDTSAPTVEITAGPTGLTSDATPTFAFTAEAGATVTCRVDGGGFAACASPLTLPALADGEHTFTVRAVDVLGQQGLASATFTVDTAAPTLGLDVDSPTRDTTPTVTISAGADALDLECRVDGGAFAACTSPLEPGPLSEGDHTIDARAHDLAGNQATASTTVVIDLTAPTITLTGGPTGVTGDATPTFTFVGSADVVGTTCALDGGAAAACTSPHTTTSLADGAHTLVVAGTDAAGNVGTLTVDFTVDTSAPTVSITSGPSGPTSQTSATFTFTLSEVGLDVTCRLGGGAFAPCASPITYPGPLAPGAYTFEVQASDGVSTASDTRSFTVDTAAPVVTITSGPTGATSDATPTFGFSVDDATATATCWVDGGAPASCTSPYTTATLADGPHTLHVRATDGAGNQGDASRAFSVDTVAPGVTITSGPAGVTADSTPTFTFASPDAGATFACRVDGGAWGACTSPHTTAALADGDHAFEVQATDAAGNTSSDSRTFTVDTTTPTVTITAGPSGVTDDSTPTFEFTDTLAATRECKLDAGAYAACTSPHTTATLADGAHTFTVRVTGAGGATASASRTFTVDTTTPTVTITSGPAGLTNNAAPTFTFTDTFAASRECKVDGGAYAACTSPHTTAALAEGAHTFTVRVTGPAGATASASRAFTVDTTPPTVDITAPTGTVNDATPTIAFTLGAGALAAECQMDSGAWAACTSGTAWTWLASGAHTLRVRTSDTAGNTASATSNFTVDAVEIVPVWRGPLPAADATLDYATFSFGPSATEPGATLECSKGGSWSDCTGGTFTFRDMVYGTPQTFLVRLRHPGGTLASVSLSHNWTPHTGLVAHYPFEVDGDDVGPNANMVDLDLAAAGTAVAGAVDDGLLLDEPARSGKDTSDVMSSSPTNTYTYAMWVERAGMGQAGPTLWANATWPAFDQGCIFSTLGFECVGGTAGAVGGSAPLPPDGDLWLHVTWVFQGSEGASGPIELYYDGSRVDMFLNPGGQPFFDGPAELEVGDTGVLVDDLRIYNQALAPDAICEDLVGGTFTGSSCDLTGGGGGDLLFYYPLDEDFANHSGHPVYGAVGDLVDDTGDAILVSGYQGKAVHGSQLSAALTDALSSAPSGAYTAAWWTRNVGGAVAFYRGANLATYTEHGGADSLTRVQDLADARYAEPAGDVFHHLALRFNAAAGTPGAVEVFVDGSLVDTIANPGGVLTIQDVTTLRLKSAVAVDELRIYAGALTNTEICTLAGGIACGGSSGELLFYYPFDGDLENHSNHPIYGAVGALEPGAEAAQYVAGITGSAVTHPGLLAEFADALASDPDGAYTLMYATPKPGTALSLRDGALEPVIVEHGRVRIEGLADTSFAAPENQWVHIALRFRASAGTPGDVDIFVDGERVATVANGAGLPTAAGLTGMQLKAYQPVDELRIYAGALSDDELCALSGSSTCVGGGSGLMFYYPFENSLANQSGHAVYGGLGTVTQPGATFPAGWDQRGVAFADLAAIKPEDAYSSSTTGAYTAAYWVQAGDGQHLEWSDDLGHRLLFGSGRFEATGLPTTTFEFPTTTWVHHAIVFEGAGGHAGDVRMYVDGRQVAHVPNPTHATTVQGIDEIRLTVLPGNVLDELRLYDRALSPQQICEELAMRFWDGSACTDPP